MQMNIECRTLNAHFRRVCLTSAVRHFFFDVRFCPEETCLSIHVPKYGNVFVPPFQGSIWGGALSQGLRPGLICYAPSGLGNQSREAAAQNSPGREPWVKDQAM